MKWSRCFGLGCVLHLNLRAPLAGQSSRSAKKEAAARRKRERERAQADANHEYDVTCGVLRCPQPQHTLPDRALVHQAAILRCCYSPKADYIGSARGGFHSSKVLGFWRDVLHHSSEALVVFTSNFCLRRVCGCSFFCPRRPPQTSSSG